MDMIPGLSPHAFEKADRSGDDAFYAQPRFVCHIDEAAISVVTDLYRRVLPAGGSVLDLMSSWVSHLPAEAIFAEVIGHGMNAAELAANPRLDRWFVQDLNADPVLPLATGSVGSACICVGVQYLQRPISVLTDVARVLRPGAPVVVTFSNRCFPTKAVAIWQGLDGSGHQRLVSTYLDRAGFASIEAGGHMRSGSDPLRWVIGRKPAG